MIRTTAIRRLCFAVIGIAMLATSPVVNGQGNNFDDVEITATKLDDNLYYLQGREDRSVCWPAPTAY